MEKSSHSVTVLPGLRCWYPCPELQARERCWIPSCDNGFIPDKDPNSLAVGIEVGEPCSPRCLRPGDPLHDLPVRRLVEFPGIRDQVGTTPRDCNVKLVTHPGSTGRSPTTAHQEDAVMEPLNERQCRGIVVAVVNEPAISEHPQWIVAREFSIHVDDANGAVGTTGEARPVVVVAAYGRPVEGAEAIDISILARATARAVRCNMCSSMLDTKAARSRL
jgi:hypothetical protein